MFFLELRTPDRFVSIDEAMGLALKKRLKEEALSQDHYFYVNEKRQNSIKFKVRPSSRFLFYFDLKDSHFKSQPMQDSWVVHEDKEIVVINKPAGLSTQQTLKSHETHLFGEARLYYLKKHNWPMNLPYVGLHHRLDRDTSGLVLMTKKKGANKEVSELFKSRKIIKKYMALVEAGTEKPPEKWVERGRIKRGFSPKHPFIFKVAKTGGNDALSEFRYMRSLEDGTHLVEAFPKTGRTHQLRVHLAHKDWPIIGDRVYNPNEKGEGLKLHAYRLDFQLKGKDFSVEALPDWLP